MANAAPKLEIGKLTPEDSERLAASFRPAWELDDAPFAHVSTEGGNGLSAEDIDALAGGAGVASSVRGASNGVHAAEAETAIEIDLEPDATPAAQAPVAQAPAPRVAEARAQQPASKPYTPPRAPPPAVKMSRDAASGEYSAVKKSNTGIIVGIVAVVVVVGGIFGVRAAMSGDTPVSKTNTTANTNAMGPNIPPPPDNVTVAATTQTAAPVTPPPPVQKANDAVPVRTFPETATTTTPTHTTVAPPIHTTTTVATHATTQPTHTNPGKPAGHGAIVRDNPF